MPHTLETAQNRVNSFRTFSSETSEEMTNLIAVNSAHDMLKHLYDSNLLFPSIFAGAEEDENGIRFEWSDDSLDLLITVEMDNEGGFWFFAMHPEEGYNESAEIVSSQEAKTLLTRLLAGNSDLLSRYAALDIINSIAPQGTTVSEQSIQQARSLLTELAIRGIVALPSFFVTEDGNLLLGWANAAYVVDVEVDGNSYECYQLGTEGTVDGSSSFSTKSLDDAAAFFLGKEALFLEWEENHQ